MIRTLSILALTATMISAASAQQYVYPAKGQSPQQQQSDEAACHTWAIQQTGFDPAHLELLVSFYNAAGMTDQRTHIFLARDLRQVGRAADGIEESYLEVHEVPFSAVPAMIASGELCDAKTVIGLIMAAQRLGR